MKRPQFSREYEFRRMQEKFDDKARFLEQPKVLKKKKIRFTGLAAFLVDYGDELGENISRADNISFLENFFEIGKIIFSAADCVYIAYLLIKAQFNNEPLDFKLSKAGRLFYGTIVLALGLACLLASTALAASLLVALSATVLVGSIVGLAWLVYKHIRLSKKLKINQEALNKELRALEKLQEKIKQLEPQARQLDETAYNDLLEQFEARKQKIILLKHEKAILLAQREKIGLIKYADKIMALNLGIVSLTGFIIALSFPPVGLTIATVTFCVGLGYTLGRISPYVYEKGKEYFKEILFSRHKEIHKRNDSSQEQVFKASIELEDLPKVTKIPKPVSEPHAILFPKAVGCKQDKQEKKEGEGEGKDAEYHAHH